MHRRIGGSKKQVWEALHRPTKPRSHHQCFSRERAEPSRLILHWPSKCSCRRASGRSGSRTPPKIRSEPVRVHVFKLPAPFIQILGREKMTPQGKITPYTVHTCVTDFLVLGSRTSGSANLRGVPRSLLYSTGENARAARLSLLIKVL